jgi:hypothetical protein
MSDDETNRLLTEINEKLASINNTLNNIKDDLRTDRSNLWKILALAIGGAFALVGIKLAIP